MNIKNGKEEKHPITRKSNNESKKAKVRELTGLYDYYSLAGKDYKWGFEFVHFDYYPYLQTAEACAKHWKKSWGFYWRHDTYNMILSGNFNGGGYNSPSLNYSFNYNEDCYVCNGIDYNLLGSWYNCIANVNANFSMAIKTGEVKTFTYNF